MESSIFKNLEKTALQDSKILKKYEVIEKINECNSKMIYKVKEKENKNIRALKVVFENSEYAKSILKENLILKKLKKTSFPQIYLIDTWKNGHYLQMEYLQQNLEEQSDSNQYNLEEIEDFMVASINVIEKLHQQNILHRNIHPRHFMRRKNGELVLIDFSEAIKIKGYKDSSILIEDFSKKDFVGSYPFASVSYHLKKPLSKKDDLESLFYIAYYLFKKKLPWYHPKSTVMKEMIHLVKEQEGKKMMEQLGGKFLQAFNYIKKLKADSDPDFSLLKSFFLMEPDFKKYKSSEVKATNRKSQLSQANSTLSQQTTTFQKEKQNPPIFKYKIKKPPNQKKVTLPKQEHSENIQESKENIDTQCLEMQNNYRSVNFKNPFFKH